jgi:hypothetical protein
MTELVKITGKDQAVYAAYVANKRLRIIHRWFNDRHEFAVSITGGKWNVNTLFQPKLGDAIRFMTEEILQRHPRAKWHVTTDATDRF